MPLLLLLTGPSSGLRYEVRSEATLGRSSHCEIPLEDGKVSRRHARVELRTGDAFLCDLGSRNGTLINGERVAKEIQLRPGDRFQIGDTTVLYEPEALESRDEATQADFAGAPAQDLLPAEGLSAFMVGLTKTVLAAPSGSAVLRRGVELLLNRLNAKSATVLVNRPDGLIVAANAGHDPSEVPKPLSQRVLGRGESVWDEDALCVPLGQGGSGIGVLFLERTLPFTPDERQMVTTAALMLGDIWIHGRPAPEGALSAPVGTAESFLSVLDQVRKLAQGKDNLLLVGEVGTGKRTLARYLHARSERAGPLVVVDCREPQPLVEDALFGRPASPGLLPVSGALGRSDGGTLLIHHAEALTKSTAERLGRHITRKTAPGWNDADDVRVDLRVLATAAEGSPGSPGMDSSLFNALQATKLKVPPLRERTQDLAELFSHFAGIICARAQKNTPTLSGEANALIAAYKWPGNVEELRLIAERLATLATSEELPTYRLPPELQKVTAGADAPSLQDMIERLERDAVSEALREAKGKKIKAAAILGISRPTLDKKIEDYQLKVEKVRDDE